MGNAPAKPTTPHPLQVQHDSTADCLMRADLALRLATEYEGMKKLPWAVDAYGLYLGDMALHIFKDYPELVERELQRDHIINTLTEVRRNAHYRRKLQVTFIRTKGCCTVYEITDPERPDGLLQTQWRDWLRFLNGGEDLERCLMEIGILKKVSRKTMKRENAELAAIAANRTVVAVSQSVGNVTGGTANVTGGNASQTLNPVISPVINAASPNLSNAQTGEGSVMQPTPGGQMPSQQHMLSRPSPSYMPQQPMQPMMGPTPSFSSAGSAGQPQAYMPQYPSQGMPQYPSQGMPQYPSQGYMQSGGSGPMMYAAPQPLQPQVAAAYGSGGVSMAQAGPGPQASAMSCGPPTAPSAPAPYAPSTPPAAYAYGVPTPAQFAA